MLVLGRIFVEGSSYGELFRYFVGFFHIRLVLVSLGMLVETIQSPLERVVSTVSNLATVGASLDTLCPT